MSIAALAAGCGGAGESAEEPTAAQPIASVGAEGAGPQGSNQQGAVAAQPIGAATPPPRGTVAGAPGSGAVGGDREHPVPACGAMESYLYVAGQFQCPGGGNPLGGDPRAGARARLGNVGPHAHGPERDPMMDAHIVDLYEVPCPSGAVQVYVCLYHCPPGRTPLDM